MNLVLMGAPGSGKGTQAERIAGKYGLKHISTGDIFRGILKGSSPLRKEVEKHVSKGLFVPDDIVIDVVKTRLEKDYVDFMLDGFPRNRNQAEMLDRYLESKKTAVSYVIYLELSLAKGIERLTARRICPSCKTGYNMISMPPAKDGICDKCGSKLITRSDDNVDTIKERLKIYNDETMVLVDYYGGQKKLLRVNADNDIEQVFEDITRGLN